MTVHFEFLGYRKMSVLNRYLDKLVRPKIHIFSRSWSSYKLCVYSGIMVCILVALTLALLTDHSVLTMTGIVAIALLVTIGLAISTKIFIGEETFTFYHYQVVMVVAAAVLLWLLHQAILPCLDILIVALGTPLALGRIGCLMAGCCHGRPHSLGVCYRKEHAATGFTPYLVGVRLFPIQAVESLLVLFVVIVGITFILSGYPPGEALAWYVISYGVGRFCLEFLRGDSDRLYLLGFSEAQWTSLILLCTVVWSELAGALTFHLWHIGATAGMALTMIVVALNRKFMGILKYQLLLPRHVKEIAEAVQQVSHSSAGNTSSAESNTKLQNIPIACTSLGIRISTQKIENNAGNIRYFAFSSQKEIMTNKTAKKLADLILKLKYQTGSGEFIKGNQGVFHLLIRHQGRNNGRLPKKSKTMYSTPEHSNDLRQEIVNGFLYSHNRLNINTQLAFDAQSQLNALIHLLSEKEIISNKELEEQKDISAKNLSEEFQDREIGALMQDNVPDKYNLKEVAKLDCSNRIHLCRAACCRLSFALSGQDVQEGIVRWNLGQPYMIAHDKDGYCSHLDRESLTCTIYAHQPVTCQCYNCRDDKRIWLDFDNMVINPDIIRTDWPYNVKTKRIEDTRHDQQSVESASIS